MSNNINFFIGTYEEKENQSLFHYELNTINLTWKIIFSSRGFTHPSYLSLNKDKQLLYITEETSMYQNYESGVISCYDLTKKEKICALPTLGTYPCHVSYSTSTNLLFVSNYGSGSLSIFSLTNSGTLKQLLEIKQHFGHSIDSLRQEAPHIHFSQPDSTSSLIWTVDLGTDMVIGYDISTTPPPIRPLKKISLPKGCGPRHLVLTHQNFQIFLYVVCELTNEIIVINSSTQQIIQAISTLTTNNIESYCSAIKLSPDNNFLYVANRGADTISVFCIEKNGLLTLIQSISSQGHFPRDLAVFENILLVANQNSNTINIFKRISSTGLLIPCFEEIPCPTPTCII